MDFTASTMSSVGAGTLDHLEAVVIDLHRSYRSQQASELLPVARAYRHGVEQLLGGKHTIAEVRELYLHAANLSDLLSDLTHDLGAHLAAEAWAIDSYQHAELAGHNEASAWASGALASWSEYAGRPAKAIAAAERGLSKAPRHSPFAARLYGRAARGYALQGNQTACLERLAEARNICDRLPDESPSRFSTESRAYTSCIVSSQAAGCHNRLGGSIGKQCGTLTMHAPSSRRRPAKPKLFVSNLALLWPALAHPTKLPNTASRPSPHLVSSASFCRAPASSTPY